jgi:hypothetical protein
MAGLDPAIHLFTKMCFNTRAEMPNASSRGQSTVE